MLEQASQSNCAALSMLRSQQQMLTACTHVLARLFQLLLHVLIASALRKQLADVTGQAQAIAAESGFIEFHRLLAKNCG